jgi:hypothetical protein
MCSDPARLLVKQGWRIFGAVERYDVAWPSPKCWAKRYRQLGAAGMQDRSLRPVSERNRPPG